MIIKANRTPPKVKFQVLEHAEFLQVQIEDELVPHIRPKKNLEGTIKEQTANEIAQRIRDSIYHYLELLVANIIAANSIYPAFKENRKEIFVKEMTNRRIYQDNAIGNCYHLLQCLHHATTSTQIDIDLNRCQRHIDGLMFQAGVIRKWKRSDSGIWNKYLG